METMINDFFQTQAGQLAIWVLALPIVDWVLGLLAAVRDKTFALDSIMAFLRTQLFGRVFPIWLLLLVGEFTKSIQLPIVNLPLLTTLGVTAATGYLAETIGSILKSWGSTNPSAPTVLKRDDKQPVPQA